jgi:diketogulonate reductase-like aldo/keto reductase
VTVNLFFEPLVGKALDRTNIPRDDLFVQTKFVSQPLHNPFVPPYPSYEGANAQEACLTSLYRSFENLQTHYVDAFLINAPDLPPPSIHSLFEILRKVKARGLIRYIGICNVPTVEILEELHTGYSDVLQVVQNPLHSPTDPSYDIYQYCRQHAIHYNTFHTLTTSDRFVQHEDTKAIANAKNITPEQAFLQYCVQSDITPLVGARSQNNLKLALAVANSEIEPLSTDEMAFFESLMDEQAEINEDRGQRLLRQELKELRKAEGIKKRTRDLEMAFQESLADWERLEQRVVDSARQRQKEREERESEIDSALRRGLMSRTKVDDNLSDVPVTEALEEDETIEYQEGKELHEEKSGNGI